MTEQQSPYGAPSPATCPECGQPKGRGYGCGVPLAPPVLAQADSDAVAPPPAPECHCARILPALRRWVDGIDGRLATAYAIGNGQAEYEEYVAAGNALELLAREVTHG